MIRTGTLGTLPNGLLARTYTLEEKGVEVKLTNFGATLLSIKTPDKNRHVDDILLGYDHLDDYLNDPGSCMGATIAPVANRSRNAEIVLDGVRYTLPKNDGPQKQHNLHTNLEHGLNKRLWGAKIDKEHNTVLLSCALEDGELGLPGERTFCARFELSSLNDTHQQLRISYTCTTNKPTFVNMTNHAYFNLKGHGSGDVLAHRISIHAQKYLPIDNDQIPTGEIEDVAGTPFDFREERVLETNYSIASEQLRRGLGYDHCFVVDNYRDNKTVRSALYASEETSGRHLHIAISTPGAQFYTGGHLNCANAKAGAAYKPFSGFAFEPQFYPDCSHISSWPQPVCTQSKPYCSTIVYTFSSDIIETEDDIYDM